MSNRKKVLCIFLFLLVFFPTYAMANGEVMVEVPGKAKDLEGRVYYIGEFIGSDLEFSWEFQDLKNRGIDISKEDYQKKEKQDEVASFIEERGIAPIGQVSSDDQGKISYLPKKKGLYAILYSNKKVGTEVYRYSPSFFIYQESGIEITPKVEVFPQKDLEKMDLVKVWFKDKEENRPDQVLVYLYDDGKVVRQAKLSEENLWRSTWTNLDVEKTYALVEAIPKGYRGEVVEEEGVFYIKNTWLEEQPGEEPTDNNEDDSAEKPHKDSDEKSDSKSEDGSNKISKDKEKLPQTGLLWWPLPLLLAGGFIFFALSLRENNNEK